MNDVDAIDGVVKRATRRKHSARFKAEVLEACRQPDASAAAIAKLYNLNANVVHRWRADDRKASPKATDAATLDAGSRDFRIELKRGSATAVVHWPVESASSCAALAARVEQHRAPAKTEDKEQPRRTPLPADLPHVDVHHEPESTTCTCGCAPDRIGEDVAEKLDYVPGVFTVQRHVRGKWACAKCHTLIQAPVPAQVIDKGIPTAGLLAQVMVAKYADHLPLYRQETIFGRAGLAIPRSTLGAWVGACGVRLQPLADALKEAILDHHVLHAEQTPVPARTSLLSLPIPSLGRGHRASRIHRHAQGRRRATLP